MLRESIYCGASVDCHTVHEIKNAGDCLDEELKLRKSLLGKSFAKTFNTNSFPNNFHSS